MDQLPFSQAETTKDRTRTAAAFDRHDLLDLYIKKVAAGENGYQIKLYRMLSEGLLYVPIGESARRRAKPASQGDLLAVHEGGRTLIPVFTTRAALRRWCQAQGHSVDSAVLLGAELAAHLEPDAWLWLNPDNYGSLMIEPEISAILAGQEMDGERQLGRTRQPTVAAPRILNDAGYSAAGDTKDGEPSLTVSELIPISRLQRVEEE